ncbi:hypothetical protein ACGI42_22105, partial [Escherichia coli]
AGLNISKSGNYTNLCTGSVLFLYQNMLIADPDNGFILSAMGREGLELLLDEMIHDLNTHGMPEAPVTH